MLYHDTPLGKLSVMGLGCWNFGAQWNNKVTVDEAIKIIRYAIDNGINFVDVAETYGDPEGQCEQILGKALKDGYREKVFLVSKVGWYGRREKNHFTVKPSLYTRILRRVYNKLNHYKSVDLTGRTPELIRLCGHACCGRLNTSYIDLLLCHDGNPENPQAFIDGFRQLKTEGYIKQYGISTDSYEVLKHFYELSNGECAACECDYSILNRSAESHIFKYCIEKNIAILTRGSLCRGLLSGKYNLNTHFTESSRSSWNKDGKDRSEYEALISKIEKLKKELKEERLTEVAYQYTFSRPEHPVIVIGCTSLNQIAENIKIGSEYMYSPQFDIVNKITAI